MTTIYKVVDEGSWVEPEYRDIQYFSTQEKAEQYIHNVAKDYSIDEDVQAEVESKYSIYEVVLDGALEQ